MTSASAVAKDLSLVALLDAIPTDLSPGVGGRLAHQQACPRGITQGVAGFFWSVLFDPDSDSDPDPDPTES